MKLVFTAGVVVVAAFVLFVALIVGPATSGALWAQRQEDAQRQVRGGCGGGPALAAAGNTRWDEEQLRIAGVIVGVAGEAGVGAQGAVVGVATAIVESGLRNLPFGDRDSLGVFQQRPSQGWGSVAQVLDPRYAADQFFVRLAAIPGWDRLPLTDAAQRVQRSAFPDRYGEHEAEARELVGQLTGQVVLAACMPATSGVWALPLPAQWVHPPLADHWDGQPAVDIGPGGIDGAPVFAMAAGTVRPVDEPKGCGTGVELDVAVAGGSAAILYCHLSVRLVSGGAVALGDPLGQVGSTGHSTAPHLHVQITYGGRLVCPQPLIDAVALGQPAPEVSTLPDSGPCARASRA